MAIDYPLRITARGTSNGRVLRALASGRIGWTLGLRHYFHQRVRFGLNEFTPAAATSQVLDLNALYPRLPFPGNVRRLSGTYAFVEEGLAGTGITVANIEIGDAEDPNGLLTASSVLPAALGLVPNTPSAAENSSRPEPAFAPTLRVVLTGGNMTALGSGIVHVYIPFEPIPVA